MRVRAHLQAVEVVGVEERQPCHLEVVEGEVEVVRRLHEEELEGVEEDLLDDLKAGVEAAEAVRLVWTQVRKTCSAEGVEVEVGQKEWR